LPENSTLDQGQDAFDKNITPAGVNAAEDGKDLKTEQFRHGKEFRLINPALQNSHAIFSEFSQDVVSFLLDAPWPFPYISANEKADGCKKTELPVFEWVIDEEG
jgi:hypothetical protein